MYKVFCTITKKIFLDLLARLAIEPDSTNCFSAGFFSVGKTVSRRKFFYLNQNKSYNNLQLCPKVKSYHSKTLSNNKTPGQILCQHGVSHSLHIHNAIFIAEIGHKDNLGLPG